MFYTECFPGGSDGKESICNAGELGSIPESGRSLGGEHGNTLQYSCLENSPGQRSYSPWGCKESDTTESWSTYIKNRGVKSWGNFQDHVEITGRDCIWIQAAAEYVFWTRPHERSFVSLVFLFLKIMLGKNKQSPLPKFNKNCSLAISLTFLFPNLLYLYSNHGWKK